MCDSILGLLLHERQLVVGRAELPNTPEHTTFSLGEF